MTLLRAEDLACPPTWGTPRDYSRATWGPDIGRVAAKLGKPAMPWQQHVWDVATEIDPDTGGLWYREVVVTVSRQSGKALDVATPLLTADRGWTTMGDVRPGDRLLHPDGQPVTVTHVSDVMAGHDCYEVVTTDGRRLVADADHLWTVRDVRVPAAGELTLTTAELLDRGLMRTAREFAYRLPVQRALDLPDVDLPIDPYVLGMWLGDGSSRAAALAVGDDDLQHVRDQLAAAGARVVSARRDRTVWMVAFATTARHRDKLAGFGAVARRLGVWGNKHVPDVYLTASAEQRLALLQGLLDTDGSISQARKSSPSARVEFTSTRRELADGVLFLARSLGWRATLRRDDATLRGRVVGDRWRVAWTPQQGDPAPFRLPRKAARVQAGRARGGERTAVSVRSVTPVPSRPVRCIKVDAPDGLFLAGRDLVATHNTSLNLPRVVWRAEFAEHLGGRQRMLYAAQTGKDARAKWEDDYVADLQAAPVMRFGRPGARFTVVRQTGRERVRFRGGSLFSPIATMETSGHGGTLDDATLDEAFAQTDNRVEAAWRPAMITRRHAQMWVESTAGTSRSTYLRGKVNRGRALVESGRPSRTAYFEWSAPRDADPADPATWRLCMPALGFTQTVEAVQHEYESIEGGLPEFRRAYLNQWSDEFDDREWVLPKASWRACMDETSRRAGPPALAVETDPERATSTVTYAAVRADGLPMIEAVRQGPGVGWIAEHVGQLVREKAATCVVLQKVSPAHTELPAIERAVGGRCPVWVTQADETADAWGSAYDAVVTEQVRHLGQAEFDTELAGAVTRDLTGGRSVLDPFKSAGPITALVGATLALAGLARYPGGDKILW